MEPPFSIADLEQNDPHAPAIAAGDRRFLCPLCGPLHKQDSSHRSLSANVNTGAWFCHRCGEKGKLRDFWTEREAQARPTSRRNRARVGLQRMAVRPNDPEPPRPPDPAKEAAWRDAASRSTLIEGTPAAEYLTRRAIPIDLAKAARVRYCADWYGRPAALFAIYDPAGALVAAQGRYIDGKTNPKTRTGGPVKAGAFATPGAWEAAGLTIAEAPIDALTLAAAGCPAIAICGKDLRKWITQKCARRRVYLAFDADEAGELAAAEWTAELQRFGATITRLCPQAGVKDWNELATRDGIEAVKAALRQIVDTAPSAVHSPWLATQRLAAVHAIVAAGGNTQALTAAIVALVDVCDLPHGYTDPADVFADVALETLAAALGELRRMTPDLQKLLPMSD